MEKMEALNNFSKSERGVISQKDELRFAFVILSRNRTRLQNLLMLVVRL